MATSCCYRRCRDDDFGTHNKSPTRATAQNSSSESLKEATRSTHHDQQQVSSRHHSFCSSLKRLLQLQSLVQRQATSCWARESSQQRLIDGRQGLEVMQCARTARSGSRGHRDRSLGDGDGESLLVPEAVAAAAAESSPLPPSTWQCNRLFAGNNSSSASDGETKSSSEQMYLQSNNRRREERRRSNSGSESSNNQSRAAFSAPYLASVYLILAATTTTATTLHLLMLFARLQPVTASHIKTTTTLTSTNIDHHHRQLQHQKISPPTQQAANERSKLARQILAGHYQDHNQLLSHIQNRATAAAAKIPGNHQEQPQQQQHQATTHSWPQYEHYLQNSYHSAGAATHSDLQAASSSRHQVAVEANPWASSGDPTEKFATTSSSSSSRGLPASFVAQQPEPPVNQPPAQAAQLTTPTLNKQLVRPPSPYYELGLMPTNVLQLSSSVVEHHESGAPHVHQQHAHVTRPMMMGNLDGAPVGQHQSQAHQMMHASESIVRPQFAEMLQPPPPQPQQQPLKHANSSAAGANRDSRSMINFHPDILGKSNDQLDVGSGGGADQVSSQSDASGSVTASNSQNSDSKFDDNNHHNSNSNNDSGEQQQQQQQHQGPVDKGIEPRQKRRMFNRILKKAEWNHLFVELSKVFLRYFLDLALKDIIGKQSASLSGSSSSGDSTTGRKKLDAQSELADMLKEFVKTAISNLR